MSLLAGVPNSMKREDAEAEFAHLLRSLTALHEGRRRWRPYPPE